MTQHVQLCLTSMLSYTCMVEYIELCIHDLLCRATRALTSMHSYACIASLLRLASSHTSKISYNVGPGARGCIQIITCKQLKICILVAVRYSIRDYYILCEPFILNAPLL
jgi:hypothetical protein